MPDKAKEAAETAEAVLKRLLNAGQYDGAYAKAHIENIAAIIAEKMGPAIEAAFLEGCETVFTLLDPDKKSPDRRYVDSYWRCSDARAALAPAAEGMEEAK